MSLDLAGNYLFSMDDEVDLSEYRVIKMDIFAQREFLGIIRGAFIDVNEKGVDGQGGFKYEMTSQLDLYSSQCNDAQDYLFDRVSVKTGDNKWLQLSRANLIRHLDSIDGRTPIVSMNSIFTVAVGELLGNFTGTGVALNLNNSIHQRVVKSNVVNLATQLSKTSS
jgi:hypothetical protein